LSWRRGGSGGICRSRRCGAAQGILESGDARLQVVDSLLFVRDLLIEVIELGFAYGVVGVIGIRVDGILFEGEFALEKIDGFLRVGKLLLQVGKFSGGFGFLAGVIGVCSGSGFRGAWSGIISRRGVG